MSGTADMHDVISLLEESGAAWVRLATSNAGELRAFEATLGVSPPSWSEVDWNYSSARFIATRSAGSTVAQWLGAGEVKVRDLVVPLTDLAPNAITNRRQSMEAMAGHEPLGWPSDEWSISLQRSNAFSGELIGIGDSPSFVSFDWAAANLLGLPRVSPNWSLGSPEILIRRQDTSARISHVRVDLTSVDVVVEGGDLAGSVVELAGDIPGETRQLEAPDQQKMRFDTPGGLPRGAWMVLHRNGEWLDRRTLARDRRSHPEPGVEYVVHPGDAETDGPIPPDEQVRIHEAVATIKVLVRAQLQLDAGQLDELDQRLEAVAENSSRLTCRDWKVMVYGTIVMLVAEHIVTPDIAQTIFNLLCRELPHLLSTPFPMLGS